MLFVTFVNVLNAGESKFGKMHIYNRESASTQLDIIIDFNKNSVLINKMDFRGPVALGDDSHKLEKPVELKINKITKEDGSVIIEVGYSFEEGLSFKMIVDVLWDETTEKPKTASMKVESSLEELFISWVPSLLIVKQI